MFYYFFVLGMTVTFSILALVVWKTLSRVLNNRCLQKLSWTDCTLLVKGNLSFLKFVLFNIASEG
jgi:hypothetical protein